MVVRIYEQQGGRAGGIEEQNGVKMWGKGWELGKDTIMSGTENAPIRFPLFPLRASSDSSSFPQCCLGYIG